MSNKKAVLVVGPESSGTRNMTSILIDNGFSGDKGHQQKYDDLRVVDSEKPAKFVLRKSVPHGNNWPNIAMILEFFSHIGYEVKVVVTLRDFECMKASQVNAKHASSKEEAHRRTKVAYSHIFSNLVNKNFDFTVVQYETLISNTDFALSNLSKFLGEKLSSHEELYDGNKKYITKE